MNQKIIKTANNFNVNQKISWAFLVIALFCFLIYGLSIFFSRPKIETITTNPSNTGVSDNSYLHRTQEIDYKNRNNKRR